MNPLILWIDDEPIRHLRLKHLPVTIIFAHGYDQIRYYLRHSNLKFSLVILDHDMPAMNGMQVLHEFAEDLCGYRIILCSNNFSGRKNQKDYLDKLFTDHGEDPVVESYDCDITNPDFAELVERFI